MLLFVVVEMIQKDAPRGAYRLFFLAFRIEHSIYQVQGLHVIVVKRSCPVCHQRFENQKFVLFFSAIFGHTLKPQRNEGAYNNRDDGEDGRDFDYRPLSSITLPAPGKGRAGRALGICAGQSLVLVDAGTPDAF